jgi:uncharacterized membrane protein YeaQ/YmgE (transglycosylase-associated protein family)
MNKTKIVEGVKIALGTIAGIGITFLCSAFAGNIAGSSNAGALKKTCMAIGGAIVGRMLASQVEKYINDEVDNAVKNVDEIVSVAKTAQANTAE